MWQYTETIKSKMGSLVTILKGFYPLTIVSKLSVVDVCGGSG